MLSARDQARPDTHTQAPREQSKNRERSDESCCCVFGTVKLEYIDTQSITGLVVGGQVWRPSQFGYEVNALHSLACLVYLHDDGGGFHCVSMLDSAQMKTSSSFLGAHIGPEQYRRVVPHQ